MPNHVAVEVIFRNVDQPTQERILALSCNAKGEVDFEVLLPVPLYCWMGSVGSQHQVFPDNALDWCTKHWSTKWNAYGQKPIQRTDDTLTFQFDTAWSAPYGWLAALYNSLQLPFEYNYLSEGAVSGHSGRFLTPGHVFDAWKEVTCDQEMQKHLHVLRWGCESFPEEEEVEEA